jgi:pentose-5-phosphate-3-epimerase
MKIYIRNAIQDFSDMDLETKWDVARDPSTDDIDILYELSADPNARSGIASNPNTPIELLTQLSEDPEWHIRMSVARNPNTPKSILETLATDYNESVRTVVAKNPNTPIATLRYLMTSDEDSIVRKYAKKNLENNL